MSDTHTTVQYQLRLPESLREKIRESAEKHNRSMNSDMVARLEQSFEFQEPDGTLRLTKQELQEVAVYLAHFYKNNPDFEKTMK